MSGLVLYDYPRSSAAYRVRIALALKGVEFEQRQVNLLDGEQRQPAYRDIAAAGLVPALVLADGTALTQSLAILRWLDSHASEPRLFPADPIAAAQVEAMALAIACDIHPIQNLRVLNYIEQHFGADKTARAAWIAHWIRTGFAALERDVARLGGSYAFGDSVTAADIVLAPQMVNARRFKVDLTDFPLLVALDSRLRALPAFADTAPPA